MKLKDTSTIHHLPPEHRHYLIKVHVHYTMDKFDELDKRTDKVIQRVLKDRCYTDDDKVVLNSIKDKYPVK